MSPLHRELCQRTSRVALLAVLTLLPLGNAGPQTGGESPSALIRSLSVERRKRQPIKVSFHCGQITGPRWERRTGRELVRLGRTAVPDLDRAFDSLEREGRESSLLQNSGWLFCAYARILGPKAALRLRRMMMDPKLSDARCDLDDALALSLGLTSYVSGTSHQVFFACLPPQPRYALNELIVSLQHGDLAKLQESLGPEAHKALDQALQARSWQKLRQEAWRLRPGIDSAVGYRLEIQGPWSEPEETLEQPREEYRGSLLTTDKFSLETQFTDRAGNACARYKVDFLKVSALPGQNIYRIDNADIEDLLRSIAACAAE